MKTQSELLKLRLRANSVPAMIVAGEFLKTILRLYEPMRPQPVIVNLWRDTWTHAIEDMLPPDQHTAWRFDTTMPDFIDRGLARIRGLE